MSEMQMPTYKATIAVITCHRPEWLNRLLVSLIAQETSNVELELLVVDNAGEDATREVVQHIANKQVFPITYYHEEQRGIVFARNRCVEEFLKTDSDFLLFIDDDEWPHETNWAQSLVTKQVESNADIVTSHVISVKGEGTPDWAVDLIYGNNLLIENQSVSVFYTNNLLIKRNVLESIQPAFDKRFAMTGASDYHFALKCIKAGYKAVYTDAPVEEEFPASRAKVSWFLKRGFRSGIGFTRSHLFEDKFIKALTYCTAMALVRLVRGIFKLILGIVTLNKTTFVDGLFRVCSFAGSLAGFFGIKHEEYNTIHGK
ncbi:glycosyltransferase [Psychrosphaera sp.]|nr:glycosyltransferase [Psychrosphaera sp.]